MPVESATIDASDVNNILGEDEDFWEFNQIHREQSFRGHVFAAIDKDWNLLKLWKVENSYGQKFVLTDDDPLPMHGEL